MSRDELKQFDVTVNEDDYGDEIVVRLNGDIVFEWRDSNSVYCPEDLTWSRMISDIFADGVAAGIKLGHSQQRTE